MIMAMNRHRRFVFVCSILFAIFFFLQSFYTGGPNNDRSEIKYSDSLSFDQQLDVFKSLGYSLNAAISKFEIFNAAKNNYVPGTDLELEFKKSKFSLSYFYLGFRQANHPLYFSNNCIWYDLEFVDESSSYIDLMKRMGSISRGEIAYTDISMRLDSNGYDGIDFKVNGFLKSWKLAKVGFVDDSFFQKISTLPEELNTNGRYTYFDDGGQQFVIDYASDEEQKKFIEKTGLKREWLKDGKHFGQNK